MSNGLKSGASIPAVGIAAVLCSIVGLQLGGLMTGLFDERGSITVALVATGLVVATGGTVLGFWICSMLGAGPDES